MMSLPSEFPHINDVVIGSSPALLARAVFRAANYPSRRVVVFEDLDVVGGGWQMQSPFGDKCRYDAFEHILAGGPTARTLLEEHGLVMRERPLYYCVRDELKSTEREFLREIFGLGPVFETQGCTLIDCAQGNVLARMRQGSLRPADIEKFRQNCKKPSWMQSFAASTANTYLQTNFDDLLLKIEHAVKERGIEVRLREKVDIIDASDQSRLTLHGSFGTITADRVLLGKYFNGRILGRSGEIAMRFSAARRTTLIMRLFSRKPQPYEYVKFLGDEDYSALQRVFSHSDEPDNTAAFCVHLRTSQPNVTSIEEAAPRAMETFVGHKLLNIDTRVDAAAWLKLNFVRGVEASQAEIAEQSNGRIDVLAFTNLGREIADNQDVWRVVLASPFAFGNAQPILGLGNLWSMLHARFSRATKRLIYRDVA